MKTRQLQEQVNETIIQALHAGKVPWRSDHGFPNNILSRRRFDGLPGLLLMIACERQGFTSCYWGTRQEWEALGGRITNSVANFSAWSSHLACRSSAYFRRAAWMARSSLV